MTSAIRADMNRMFRHASHRSSIVDTQVNALFSSRRSPRISLRRFSFEVVTPWLLLACAVSIFIPLISAALTPPSTSWVGAVGFVVSAALIFIAQLISAEASRYPLIEQGAVACTGFIAMWVFMRSGHAYAATVMGAIAATALGWLIAHNVARLMWVVPLGICASASDIHSVYFGFTRNNVLDSKTADLTSSVSPDTVLQPMQAHAPAVVEMLTVTLPSPGGAWMLGMVDIMFAAVMVSLVRRYELSKLRTGVALAVAIACAAAVPQGVPVIPLLTGAFLTAHAQPAWRTVRHSLTLLALMARPTGLPSQPLQPIR